MFFTHETINNNIFRATMRYGALEVESINVSLTEIWSYFGMFSWIKLIYLNFT